MTDLKYRIMQYIHDAPAIDPHSVVDVLSHFANVPSTEIQAALRELEGSRYIKKEIGSYHLAVTLPAGVLALDTECDLRRREALSQQQFDTQCRKDAAREAKQEAERKRDRNVMLLSGGIGAAGAILGGVLTALITHWLG